jgi:3-oxosteroid 1-dehydrogenase
MTQLLDTPDRSSPAPRLWDREVDLLIFGSGAGGLSASLFAAKKGLEVLLCEKSDLIGGTTATSGGVAWIPGNDQAKQAGLKDSIDDARSYLRHELGNYYRADLIDAFLDSGRTALNAIETDTEVKFDHLPWPDYHPEQAGAVPKGRSVVARPFDGRRLGRDFALVRPPIHRLMILGGLMIGAEEIPDFLNPFASPKVFGRVVRKVARYASDRVRNPRGTDVRNGNALVSRLLLSLRQRNVPIWTEAPLVSLLTSGGRVVGATLSRGGKTLRIHARSGVVLATGGFPRNASMRREYGNDYPHDFTLAYEGNTGDGIQAALAVGGGVDTELASPGLWTPASVVKDRDGKEIPVIYGYLDRGRPGIIAVNAEGKRFVNESNSYHDIVMAMYEQGAGDGAHFYFVCDRNFVRKHGLGVMRPSPLTLSIKPFVRSGYIHAADTLTGLARQIGVNAQGLAETVKRHNEFARTGIDLDFGKGANVYNRQFGDKGVEPNPNLVPIVEPPFIALRIHAATLGTTRGLRTNGDAQALDTSGNPIDGLYACGNELASAMRGLYPGGGVTIGPAIVFAFRAVEHAAARTERFISAENDGKDQ